LGVEQSVDNIHNYDDANIKEELKEITDKIGNLHTNINDIITKLNNIISTTTKLSLNNTCSGIMSSNKVTITHQNLLHGIHKF
jgi:regulator of replication initiation timing